MEKQLSVYYRKKQLIRILETYENGSKLVMNVGNPDDTWIIPKDVFENTYEEVK